MRNISPTLVMQVIFGLVGLAVTAFSAVAAWRLYDYSNKFKRDVTEDPDALSFLEQQGFMQRPARKRTTQCFNLQESAAIRTVKGGYIRAYRMELEPTMYAKDSTVEARYNEAATMLAQEKPEGTILQFRIANYKDGGRVINEHRAASGGKGEVYEPARILHESQLAFYEACAALDRYKDFNASMWAFVPIKHEKDNTRNGQLVTIKRAFNEIKKNGLGAALKVLFEGDDGITRRIAAEEEEMIERAERLFRQLEDASPITLTRLDRDETWEALYYGHNESATSAPPTPPPHADLRAYLCRDSISARKDDWYGLHGRTPFAMLSLFVPPEDGAPTDIMRAILLNARLSRRFTVITEYKYMVKKKARNYLKFRAKLIHNASVTKKGVQMDEDTARAYHEIKRVSEDLTRSQETLAGMDFRIILYGEPVASREELKERVKQLEIDCERMISVIRKTFFGGDAGREEKAALRALYHRSIVGEMTTAKSYRTIHEATDTLAPFMPLEKAFGGIKHPHSLISTTAGNLIGLNFYQNPYSAAALGIIIAEPGGGKSVAAVRFISDIIGTKTQAHGAGIDYGESFAPFADFIGTKKWRFIPEVETPINVWDYPGLEERVMPDDTQKNFVIEDALILCRAPREGPEGALYEAVLRKCVNEVYKDIIPNNKPGWPRQEPQHKHLVKKLMQFPFQGQQKVIALNIASILEGYVGHPWIDAPTHPSYREESIFDVFELDSLDKFAPDIKRTLAFRTAVRVCNRIGKKDANGELMTTILVFDECKRTSENYPEIMKAIRFNAARQGRKKRTFTLLCSQAWKDFADIADITSTASVKIIGKQAGDDIEDFVKAAKWTERAKEAIYSINNIKGVHSQFVISFGAGHNQQIEMIQLELSPVELWTYTTEPIEQNARTRILRLVPQWTMPEAIIYLAVKHPRGLVAEGILEPDISALPAPRPAQSIWSEELTGLSERELLGDREAAYPDGTSPDDTTIEEYRTIGTGEVGKFPEAFDPFVIQKGATPANEELPPLDLLQLAPGTDEAAVSGNQDEPINAEYVGNTETAAREAVYSALENLFDERDILGRRRADELGVDIEGAILIEPEEVASGQ